MNKDQSLTKYLLNLLKGNQAHMTLEDAVRNYPVPKINDIFPNGTYSSWHLLEHIRITQNDILEFIVNPKYKELSWPGDYWPKKEEKATQEEWERTIKGFQKDLKILEKIVMDKKTDLYTKIPWGNGQTILREILLVADHSAYHIGEFAIMRQTMNTWRNSHS